MWIVLSEAVDEGSECLRAPLRERCGSLAGRR